MPAALPHTDHVAQGFGHEVEIKTREVQFGNGYKEIAPNGINNRQEEWSLTFEALNTTEYNAVTAALDIGASGDYVTWTPFGEAVSKKWSVVGKRSESYFNGFWSVSVNLETYR